MTTAQLSPLDEAILLATKAHLGQLDPDGTPHIVHCFEVMLEMKSRLDNPEKSPALLNALKYYTPEQLLVAAILHDAPEDSFKNKTALERVDLHRVMVQYGRHVHALVDGVTRRELPKKEDYRDFIYRAKTNPGCIVLKDCDLTVNLRRNQYLTDKKWALKLSRKYFFAKRVLAEAATWEQVSMRVGYDQDKANTAHYFVDDGNGREMEISERKFARLIGDKRKESISVR